MPVSQIMLSRCLYTCRRGTADDDMGSSLKTPDDARIAQLTVEKLVVRLNSVLYLEENLPEMEKMVQERWAGMVDMLIAGIFQAGIMHTGIFVNIVHSC